MNNLISSTFGLMAAISFDVIAVPLLITLVFVFGVCGLLYYGYFKEDEQKSSIALGATLSSGAVILFRIVMFLLK